MQIARSPFWIAAAVMTLAFAASPARGDSGPNPAWEKLKGLVGEWSGTYAGSDAEGAGAVSVSYRLVSNGTVLMETLDSGHDAEMVTLYHPDGNRILATHYCSTGNQPRMAASGLSPDGKSITFAFLDATNVAPGAELMRGLVVKFDDPRRFRQSWTSRSGAGGKDQTGTFTYTRK